MNVGVHQVHMHELRPEGPRGTRDPEGKSRIGVVAGGNACEWDARRRERLVERLRRSARVVQPDEGGLDAMCPQRGQQREQVALGAADPGDPVDVDDPHQRRSRASAGGRAEAASSTRRKSHGAR